MIESKSGTKFFSLRFCSIGGGWGYAIMVIQDGRDAWKLRLAKCKRGRDFPKTEKCVWTDVLVEHINDLQHVSQINFKSKDDLSALFDNLLAGIEIIREKTDAKVK